MHADMPRERATRARENKMLTNENSFERDSQPTSGAFIKNLHAMWETEGIDFKFFITTFFLTSKIFATRGNLMRIFLDLKLNWI